MSVLFLYHTLSSFYESLSPFSSFSDRSFLSFRSFVVFHSCLPLLYTDINTRSLCGFPLSLNAGHLEKTAPPVCVSVWVQYVCVGYNFFVRWAFSELLTFSFQLMRDRCSWITLPFSLSSSSGFFSFALFSLSPSIPEVSQVWGNKSTWVWSKQHISLCYFQCLSYSQSHTKGF